MDTEIERTIEVPAEIVEEATELSINTGIPHLVHYSGFWSCAPVAMVCKRGEIVSEIGALIDRFEWGSKYFDQEGYGPIIKREGYVIEYCYHLRDSEALIDIFNQWYCLGNPREVMYDLEIREFVPSGKPVNRKVLDFIKAPSDLNYYYAINKNSIDRYTLDVDPLSVNPVALIWGDHHKSPEKINNLINPPQIRDGEFYKEDVYGRYDNLEKYSVAIQQTSLVEALMEVGLVSKMYAKSWYQVEKDLFDKVQNTHGIPSLTSEYGYFVGINPQGRETPYSAFKRLVEGYED